MREKRFSSHIGGKISAALNLCSISNGLPEITITDSVIKKYIVAQVNGTME
jgi:hypothetical protein